MLLLALSVPLALGWFALNYSYAQRLPETQLAITTMQVVFSDQPDPYSVPLGVPVTLPHDWSRQTPVTDIAWYSVVLDLDVPPNRLWGIYLPAVNMNAAVYLNGELLGEGGAFSTPAPRMWHRPLYFSIPNGILHSGDNLLQVRLQTDPAVRGWLGPLHLGPASDLRPVFEQDYFLRNTLVKLITSSLLLTGFAIGQLWLQRSQDSVYGWYALTCLCWAVHSSNLIVENIPCATRYWDAMIYMALGWFAIFLIVFIHRYLNLRRARVERGLFIFGISGSIGLLIVPEPLFYPFAVLIWDASLLTVGLYPSMLMIWAFWHRRRWMDLLLMISGLIIMALALRDWLAMSGIVGQRGEGVFLQYAAPVPLFCFGWLLMTDLVTARREVEQLNRFLEQRIADKTRELEANYQRLRTLERDRLLAEERQRIMRDMHDGVGGHLVATLALAESGTARQADIVRALHDGLDDLRLMIDSLDPVDDDLGLLLGMYRDRLDRKLAGTGIELNWQIDNVPPLLDFGPTKVLQVLRILQEAVSNAIKHSGAHTLTIRTGVNAQRHAYLEIADDGSGFNPVRPGGRGIDNMRWRAQSIGGVLTIDSGDTGVCVRLYLPEARHASPQ